MYAKVVKVAGLVIKAEQFESGRLQASLREVVAVKSVEILEYAEQAIDVFGGATMDDVQVCSGVGCAGGCG